MEFLNREELLKPVARRFADFTTSDGRQFRVRSLTERERMALEAGLVDANGKLRKEKMQTLRRRLICAALVGEDNVPLFSPGDEQAVKALAETDAKLIAEIHAAASEHCGIKDEDADARRKNLPETHAADSP